MFRGVLEMICLASNAGEPIRAVAEVLAVPGRGLEGDRYSEGCGTWSNHSGSGKEVTLIEIEAIEAVKREAGIDLAPQSARQLRDARRASQSPGRPGISSRRGRAARPPAL